MSLRFHCDCMRLQFFAQRKVATSRCLVIWNVLWGFVMQTSSVTKRPGGGELFGRTHMSCLWIPLPPAESAQIENLSSGLPSFILFIHLWAHQKSLNWHARRSRNDHRYFWTFHSKPFRPWLNHFIYIYALFIHLVFVCIGLVALGTVFINQYLLREQICAVLFAATKWLSGYLYIFTFVLK